MTERKCLESVKKLISEGYVKRGQVRLGQVRSGPDWSRQVKSGKITLDPNFF